MDTYLDSLQKVNETVHLAAPSVKDGASRMNVYACAILIVSLIVFARLRYFAKGNELVDAPVVGAKLSILARYGFFKHASNHVQYGYDKVHQLAAHPED